MSTLGKVLLFFNLVLAIVFVVLVSMDYGKVKQWTNAALVHRIAIEGLPINGNDVDEHAPDTKVVDEIGKDTLKAIYGSTGAGGGQFTGLAQVKTVEEELTQVQSKAQSNVTSAAPADQYKLFWMYLVPQCRTLGERLQLEKLIDELKKLDTEDIPKADPANNAEALQKLRLDRQQRFDALLAELNRRFLEAKTPARTGSAAANRKEIRLNVAHLLFAIETDANWRLRVMTVVGMEAYIAAISRHADQLAQMTADMQVLLQNDMATFFNQYGSLLNRIEGEAEELYLLDQYLAELNKYLKERQTLVEKRTTELAEQQKNLDNMTTETNKELVKLQAIQNDLFAIQKRLGVTQDKNDQLEAALRKLEQKK
ncbi:MAG TPA: hypothetical protein VGZ47_18020 [Gemmataceae bacterium]|jgi:hypothetical protein|nr:hypothetical protein [Gemmataceae bacterium]